MKKITLNRKTIWLPIVGISLIIIILWGIFLKVERERESILFDNQVESVLRNIQARLSLYENSLQGGKALFAASEGVSRNEWRKYVETINLHDQFPGIQGLGYSIFVKKEDLAAHEAEIRSEGFPDYHVKPIGERELYSSIIYLEPFDERNRQAFGFDMFSNEIRRDAMEKARDTGSSAASGKITLVQEITDDVQAGFLVYVPVYKNGVSLESVLERREAIVGYVYAAFRMGDFMDGLLTEEEISNLYIEIRDDLNNEDGLMFSTGSQARSFKFQTTIPFEAYGYPWQVGVQTNNNDTFLTKILGLTTAFLALIWLMSSGLVYVLLLGVIRSRETQQEERKQEQELRSSLEKEINDRTKDLQGEYEKTKENQDELEKSVAVLEKTRKASLNIMEDLQEAKAKDEAILGSIGEGLVVTDNERNVLLINKAGEEMTGLKHADLQGKKWPEALSTGGRIGVVSETGEVVEESALPITRALKEGAKIVDADHYYTRADQTRFAVSITASPLTLDGAIIGAIVVFRDISKEREIDRAKTEFVSLASHQLRTPLSSINWYAEMLLAGDAGELNDDQKNYLKEIYSGNQRMVELVNALLNTSRLELGTLAVEPEKLDPVEVAKQAIAEQQPKIEEKKLQIETNFASDIPEIMADKKLLHIIFQNLFSNAVKYTPDKGTVTFNLSHKGESLLLSVADTGYGIPKDQHSKIFSKLFRADNIKAKDTEGTGLGLYLVKSIVEKAGGTISFESEEDKGTTFSVVLPFSGMKHKDTA